MKNVFLFLFSILVLASCSNDDNASANEPEVPQPDPNLLSEIVFWPQVSTSKRIWQFDEDGYLKEIQDAGGNTVQTFEYDANHNLISSSEGNSTHLFTYGIDNRITSLNGITINFDPLTDTYFYDFGVPDPTQEGYDTYGIRWLLNDERYLLEGKQVGVNQNGDFAMINAINQYENGNLKNCWYGDIAFTHYTFDNHPNPLKHAVSPIIKAMLLSYGSVYGDFRPTFITGHNSSSNNPVSDSHTLEDPESNEFTYEYNANGFPTVCTIKWYYHGEYEGETTYIEYHYQGDE